MHLTFQKRELFLLSSPLLSSSKVTTIARNFFLFERICSFGTRAEAITTEQRREEKSGERRKAVSPKHTLNLSFCVWQQGLMRQREWFSGREGWRGRGDHPRTAEEGEGRALPIVVTFQREEEEEEEEGEDYLSSLVQEL